MVYKILYLYPDLLDLYGDSGNIEVLKYRLKQRGIECVVDTYSIFEEKPNFSDYNLIFMGGETSFGNGFYEEAFQRYEKSAVGFTDLYETVLVKRTAAQVAIDSAQKKIDSAAAIAAEADEKAPLQDEGENQE